MPIRAARNATAGRYRVLPPAVRIGRRPVSGGSMVSAEGVDDGESAGPRLLELHRFGVDGPVGVHRDRETSFHVAHADLAERARLGPICGASSECRSVAAQRCLTRH
jgi:hypothetical protein